MSASGMHNFTGRNTGHGVVRSIAMIRDLDRFIAEMGEEPLTQDEAYEAGLEGGKLVLGRKRPLRWVRVMPAVGVDCLAALNRGCEDAGEIEPQWEQDFGAQSAFVDSYWEDYGPMDSVNAAHAEAEWEISRQKYDAWALHDCGFIKEEDMPVFLRRVV